jgi:uncharacterized membrane protein YoaK (UPF0700 family)
MPNDCNEDWGFSPQKQGGIVHEELNRARSLALAVALGAALGAAGGAATGHIGIWVGAGIAAYIALTLGHDIWKPKANDQRRTTND